MTREEILAMDEIELSLVVAEEIFHAKVISQEKHPEMKLLVGDFGVDAIQPMKGKWHNAYWRNSDEEAWQDCPKFADDMNAAWRVVEKMRFNHWYFMISSENDGWEASFYWDANRPSKDALCATAPEAICKAALLAVLDL